MYGCKIVVQFFPEHPVYIINKYKLWCCTVATLWCLNFVQFFMEHPVYAGTLCSEKNTHSQFLSYFHE